jgi:hypothetical protein
LRGDVLGSDVLGSDVLGSDVLGSDVLGSIKLSQPAMSSAPPIGVIAPSRFGALLLSPSRTVSPTMAYKDPENTAVPAKISRKDQCCALSDSRSAIAVRSRSTTAWIR